MSVTTVVVLGVKEWRVQPAVREMREVCTCSLTLDAEEDTDLPGMTEMP